MNFRNVIKTILSLFIALSGFTSAFYLILNRTEVKKGFFVVNQNLFKKLKPVKASDNKFWAEEILNGGYILFFRHAERDKFNDVYTFDRIEAASLNNGKIVRGTRFGENEYFKDAVCLNKRGEIQANAMSEIIKLSK